MDNIFESIKFLGLADKRNTDGSYEEVTQKEFEDICKCLDSTSKSILKAMKDECTKSGKAHKCSITPDINVLKDEVRKSGKCIIKSISITAMPEKK